MHTLILSISFSVAVSIFLKLARGGGIRIDIAADGKPGVLSRGIEKEDRDIGRPERPVVQPTCHQIRLIERREPSCHDHRHRQPPLSDLPTVPVVAVFAVVFVG